MVAGVHIGDVSGCDIYIRDAPDSRRKLDRPVQNPATNQSIVKLPGRQPIRAVRVSAGVDVDQANLAPFVGNASCRPRRADNLWMAPFYTVTGHITA